MTEKPPSAREPQSGWKSSQVYMMAVLCLLMGLAVGSLFRGSEPPSHTAPMSAQAASRSVPPQPTISPNSPNTAMHAMPSLEEMKAMADKKAAPWLEKLQSDPNNAHLLNQIAMIYKATHQFQDAAEYYRRVLAADPKNVGARTELASCLYYQGNVDGALAELQQSLHYNPKDANSLFNLGMIRWQGKNDAAGAVSAWEQLLKANPRLDAGKKTQVERLIAEAKRHPNTDATNTARN